MPKVRIDNPIGSMVDELCRDIYGSTEMKLNAAEVGKAVGCTAQTIRNDKKKPGSIALARLCAVAYVRGYEIKAVRKGEAE